MIEFLLGLILLPFGLVGAVFSVAFIRTLFKKH
jgi:hypothetical protein